MRRLVGTYLRFGSSLDPDVNARMHERARGLVASAPDGVTDVVPSYASLYVEYDADLVNERALRAWLDAPPAAEGAAPPREVTVPVRYDGEDLAVVAEEVGLGVDEVVRRHAATPYHVYALGFTPGFPFLGEVDPALRVSRRSAPRARVPAHAVAIAGAQTGIYPLPSPGGWRLIGTTLEPVYDPHRERPFLLEPGDTVRFDPSDGPTPPEPDPFELLPAEPDRPVLRVRAPGLSDLVVDGGRFMVGRFGLARSGPLDPACCELANRLLGNPADVPTLELNVHGATFDALDDVVVAFAGWGVAPERNGEPIEPFASFALSRGDVLAFPPARCGVRGYLALPGGIESERFLGSASVDLRGRIGRPVHAGDVLGAAGAGRPRAGFAFRPWTPAAGPAGAVTLRVAPGPQADPAAIAALTRRPFRVRFADRMGLQLDGPAVPGGELLSEATPLGAVQITTGGRPLVLLHDRGSIGGYAKPAVVVPQDLPRAAQLRPGRTVRFVLDETAAAIGDA